MAKEYVGLHICPYCRSEEIEIYDYRREDDGEGGDCICEDIRCETCEGEWTVEYRPLHYYRYEPDFIDKPEPFVEVHPDPA